MKLPWKKRKHDYSHTTREWRNWCDAVLENVRFTPDHRVIWWELMDHLEDNCADFQRIGLEREEAERRALATMGSAAEVGQAMDKAHKPWLGWLWRVSVWLMIVVMALTAWTLVFDGAVNSLWTKTKGQLYVEQPPAGTVEMVLNEDYTIWYDPVLAVQEGENCYVAFITFWVEAAAPWTGDPDFAFWQLEMADDRNTVDEDTNICRFHPPEYTGEGWTRFQYTYQIELDHSPEWVELRYPYGRGFTIRAEREVAE